MEIENLNGLITLIYLKKKKGNLQLEPLTWIIKKGQIGGLWTNSFLLQTFFYSFIVFKIFC